MIVGDNKFDAVRKSSTPFHVEIVGYDEHEGYVESLIRTVNERTTFDFQNMPYKRFSKLMLVSSLEESITCLNTLPKYI